MTNDGNKHNDVSRQALDNKHKENSREGKEQGRFARTGRHCLQQLLHLSSADWLATHIILINYILINYILINYIILILHYIH
eukprot:COSAG06_NODE_4650_length_4067_cov_2.554688_2_plen_82_part_00